MKITLSKMLHILWFRKMSYRPELNAACLCCRWTWGKDRGLWWKLVPQPSECSADLPGRRKPSRHNLPVETVSLTKNPESQTRLDKTARLCVVFLMFKQNGGFAAQKGVLPNLICYFFILFFLSTTWKTWSLRFLLSSPEVCLCVFVCKMCNEDKTQSRSRAHNGSCYGGNMHLYLPAGHR